MLRLDPHKPTSQRFSTDEPSQNRAQIVPSSLKILYQSHDAKWKVLTARKWDKLRPTISSLRALARAEEEMDSRIC